LDIVGRNSIRVTILRSHSLRNYRKVKCRSLVKWDDLRPTVPSAHLQNEKGRAEDYHSRGRQQFRIISATSFPFVSFPFHFSLSPLFSRFSLSLFSLSLSCHCSCQSFAFAFVSLFLFSLSLSLCFRFAVFALVMLRLPRPRPQRRLCCPMGRDVLRRCAREPERVSIERPQAAARPPPPRALLLAACAPPRSHLQILGRAGGFRDEQVIRTSR
jgi:hypothetical protein